MKERIPKSINKSISQFFTELHKIAMVYCEFEGISIGCAKNKPKARIKRLQGHLAECYYEETHETRWVDKAKKAAKKCGLKLIGAGRSRLAVSITWYSKKIVIKLSARDRNAPELYCAQCMCKELKRVALTPSFYWNNNLWGLVLAFPHAPIIKNGDWDVSSAMEMKWHWSNLPKKYQTKKFAERLNIMETYTRDAHEWNIGVMNGKPYLLDYDVT